MASRASSSSSLSLVLAVAGVSLLLFRGRLETSDEILMGRTAQSIARHASLTFPETFGQTSTGYGLGMPLLGAPVVWLGGAVNDGATLLPLVNALALCALALLAAVIARSLKRDRESESSPGCWLSAWVGVVILTSPLLPASLTFYSDLVAACGLMAVVAAVVSLAPDDRRAWVLSGGGALIAALARPSIAPLVLVVAAWGWRRRGLGGSVLAPALGLAVATLVSLWQNAVLRGSPFTSGYVGQEFTTPILTGLHGLLLSPERGLFVFFPALLVPMIARGDAGDANEPRRAYGRLLAAVLLVALGVHAPFWTWHGGWTAGPRFLLPVVAVAVPLIAVRLAAARWDRDGWALPAAALVAWGAWGAGVYSMFSAHRWWNEAWNFHQVESRWLFEPQLSLWQNAGYLWSQGRFEPVALRGASAWWSVPAIGFAMLVAAGALNRGRLIGEFLGGTAATVRALPRSSVAVVASALIVVVVAGLCRGPRGWERQGAGVSGGRAAYLVGVVDSPASWAGLLDLPTYGTYTLHARLEGDWLVAVDGTPALKQSADEPRRLQAAPLAVGERALHLVEITTSGPNADGSPAQIGLYWTWPGEGRVLQPAGGEYVLARELNAFERTATAIWRRAALLLATALAGAMLLAGAGRRRPGESA